MARMRSLKPEYWGDLKMARVSRDARLLYLALWNQADEWARCHGDNRWVKGHCLPYDDDLNLAAIDRLLNELAAAGRIQRYVVEGEPFLYLPKLAAHQRLEPHKTPSRLPPPPGFDQDAEKIPDQPGKIPESVTVESRSAPSEPSSQVNGISGEIPDESGKFPERSGKIVVQQVAGSREHVAGGMLQEAGGRSADKPAPRTERAHRIPDDFTITPHMREWANKNVPGLDLERATQKFILHFQSASGAKATMVKWDAAWMKWMLGDFERSSQTPSNGRAGPQRVATSDQRVADGLDVVRRLAAQEQQANQRMEIEA
jgi:hypothetical protein